MERAPTLLDLEVKFGGICGIAGDFEWNLVESRQCEREGRECIPEPHDVCGNGEGLPCDTQAGRLRSRIFDVEFGGICAIAGGFGPGSGPGAPFVDSPIGLHQSFPP